MADRYNPAQRVEVVVKPPKFFVPGGPSEEQEHPAGFKLRVRGAGGHVTHAYRCPVHGLFDASVPRADVPDEVACPLDEELDLTGCSAAEGYEIVNASRPHRCGLTSHWAGSFAGQGWAAGECKT